MKTRAVDQAKTWYKFWDEVILYSDKFHKGSCEKVQKEAIPCKVTCVRLGDFAHHLDGTEWTHRWYFAQPRFLPAMAKSYELHRNADFYIFADDDTYLLKAALLRKFSQADPAKPKATGVKYCTWDRLSGDVEPYRQCHPFLQGGGGVILSHGLLSQVADELVNCSKRFNDPDFAGSMRFAICMERLVGMDNWSEGAFIEPWSKALHSSEPKVEIPAGNVKEAPASFHRMNHSDFMWMNNKQFVEWKSAGKKYKADLGLLPLVDYVIPIVKSTYRARWKVGVTLTVPFLDAVFNATSRWRPLLGKETPEPIGYEQTYGKFIMRLICDETVEKGALIAHDITGKGGIFEYRMYPPEVRLLCNKHIK